MITEKEITALADPQNIDLSAFDGIIRQDVERRTPGILNRNVVINSAVVRWDETSGTWGLLAIGSTSECNAAVQRAKGKGYGSDVVFLSAFPAE